MTLADGYKNLIDILDEEITVYRHFLDLIRHENEILIQSKLEDLVENNRSKEAMINKLRSLERIREKRVREIAQVLNLKIDAPRLLDIANQLEMSLGDKLRSIHATLDLLIKRVKEHNEKNELLVQSALQNIKGALENLKKTLQDKPTYQNEGQINQPAPTGRFVSKEV